MVDLVGRSSTARSWAAAYGTDVLRAWRECEHYSFAVRIAFELGADRDVLREVLAQGFGPRDPALEAGLASLLEGMTPAERRQALSDDAFRKQLATVVGDGHAEAAKAMSARTLELLRMRVDVGALLQAWMQGPRVEPR